MTVKKDYTLPLNFSSYIAEECEANDNELVVRAKKEKWMIYTLENGLQTLTDTLKTAIERLGVHICTSTPATSISFDANNKKAKVSAFILKGARFPALIFNINSIL